MIRARWFKTVQNICSAIILEKFCCAVEKELKMCTGRSGGGVRARWKAWGGSHGQMHPAQTERKDKQLP